VDRSELAGAPDVMVTLPFEAFIALGGGRWDRIRAEDEGGVTYEGDVALGQRILDHLCFTP
jgi:hypothetical protein